MTTSQTGACDAALADTGPGAAAVAHPKLTLLTCILASSLAFVDGSVVNVGLPAIGKSLGGGAADLQWVINAYLLPLSALLLTGGALGDRFGRRRLLVAGVALFGLASGACALSPRLAWLLAARAGQGIGAALLLPSSLAILGGAFQGEARGRAVGAWAAASAIAGAIGPVLGGWLIDAVGWRAIFLINLPLAAAAIALAVLAVRDPRAASRRAPLDVAGAVLATAALAALVWGLTVGAGPKGWTSAAGLAVTAGVLLAFAFVAVEVRRGERAMTPPALFGSRALVGLNLMTLLLYGALGGFLVLLPYVLIRAAGYGATAAGAALLPFPLVMSLLAPAMGALAGRFGSRAPLTLGPLLVAAGFLAALRIGRDAGYWSEVAPCVLLIALGMAGAAAPLTTAVLSAVDQRHTGSASGLNSALARAGGLVATAAIGTVLAADGEALIRGFRVAAATGAVVSGLAAASAWWGLAGAVPARRGRARPNAQAGR
jgi:EmrB/QacA subfamily drug resistance transporter